MKLTKIFIIIFFLFIAGALIAMADMNMREDINFQNRFSIKSAINVNATEGVFGTVRAGSTNLTTTQLSEGTNLYYTTARVGDAVVNNSILRNTGFAAENLTSGTVPTARLSGSYTSITGVGTLTAGTWNADAITDDYVANAITVTGGTIGSNTISSGSTWTTAGTLTIGDGGDRIDVNSDTWDVTNGVITGVTSINVSGRVAVTANNITVTEPNGLCLTQNCSARIYYNGTAVIITS